MEDESSSELPSTSSPAPERVLPQLSFYSVEYPGYVEPASVPAAIHNLGGQSSVDRAFRRTGLKSDALLELSLRPGNPFSHPLPGDVIGANNLLLKVVKRKRKRGDDSSNPVDGALGEYTAEVVGIMAKTVRFRSE
jgi:general transcription factor 3C polypeptide 5 (transcription factor C subunit 1)